MSWEHATLATIPGQTPGTPEREPGRPGERWPRWVRAALPAAPLLVALVVGELLVRIHRGRLLATDSARQQALFLLRSAYPAEYDPLLGYRPRPGTSGERNLWGSAVEILPDGTRSNGAGRDLDRPCVLAVGDSYTFGDEVSDGATWPAQLERRLQRTVVNGGVFGYGLDQIVLRAESLLPRYPCAGTLVVSFIPDDVVRCEYSYRFAWKPYFDFENGELVLRNVPVPQGQPWDHRVLDALGHSDLADAVLRRVAPAVWLSGTLDVRRTHGRSAEVAERLVDRLAEAARVRGVRLLLVVQGHPGQDGAPAYPAVRRARQLGIPYLDLMVEVRGLMRADPGIRDRYFHRTLVAAWGHMTAEGNRWVAEKVAAQLARY